MNKREFYSSVDSGDKYCSWPIYEEKNVSVLLILFFLNHVEHYVRWFFVLMLCSLMLQHFTTVRCMMVTNENNLYGRERKLGKNCGWRRGKNMILVRHNVNDKSSTIEIIAIFLSFSFVSECVLFFFSATKSDYSNLKYKSYRSIDMYKNNKQPNDLINSVKKDCFFERFKRKIILSWNFHVKSHIKIYNNMFDPKETP